MPDNNVSETVETVEPQVQESVETQEPRSLSYLDHLMGGHNGKSISEKLTLDSDTETATETSEESEDEDFITSETEDLETGDEQENDGDEWFYLGETSQYRKASDAIKGIEEKDKFIGTQKQTIEELTSQQSESALLLNLYYESADRDEILEKAAQFYLPEEFRGKEDADFDTDQSLKKFWLAQEQAAQKVKEELEGLKTSQAQKAKEQKESLEKAESFVMNLAQPKKFFGAKDPSDARKASVLFKTKVESTGYSPQETAIMIHQAIGEEAAKHYLQGFRIRLREELKFDQRETQAKNKVTETIEKTPFVPSGKEAPPTNKKNPISFMDHLKFGHTKTKAH